MSEMLRRIREVREWREECRRMREGVVYEGKGERELGRVEN